MEPRGFTGSQASSNDIMQKILAHGLVKLMTRARNGKTICFYWLLEPCFSFDMFVVFDVFITSNHCSCISSQETAVNALTTWRGHVQCQKNVFQFENLEGISLSAVHSSGSFKKYSYVFNCLAGLQDCL